MPTDVCPWYAGFLIDNAIRRWIHVPDRLYGPYVRPGFTVLDVGCGMGFSTIPLARLVGDSGTVIAVDVQRQMLEYMQRKARKSSVAGRIQPRLCDPVSLPVNEPVDFAVAFWMVHEVPDQAALFRAVRKCLKQGSRFFICEPRMHVTARSFEEMMRAAGGCGFSPVERPEVALSRTVVLA